MSFERHSIPVEVPQSDFTYPQGVPEETSHLFERLRDKWASIATAAATVVAAAVAPIAAEESAHAENTETATIGMPFDGKWSSFVHPSTHPNYSADWATDIYAPPGTEARLRVSNVSGLATYTVSNVADTSCGAGKRVRVNTRVDGVDVGWTQYEHLDTNINDGDKLSPGDLLGKTKNWGNLPCYQVTNNNGVHLHVGMKNIQDNKSCYIDHYSQGIALSEGASLGILGSSNSGPNQACAETTGAAPSASPNDLIWQQNNTIFKFDGGNGFNTTSYTGGIATPDWAGTMDYNKDGRDDIVMYRRDDGTIRVVTNNPSGGWTPHADNPVRGPGFGEPAWAGVGDFDGDGKKDDIAWWTPGGNVHKLSGPNFTTSSYTSGIAPPDWAGVMDYNGDGRDDIVLYRQNDGTLRVLLNDRSGGWAGHPQNPVRGPGVGSAVWAEVGDLDGDGKAKEIAWWTPAGRLYKFHGPNFTTASYNQGMAPPDWADIMDYNKDGRDDVVVYRQNDGTLRAITNSPSGGWVSHPDNPIRGPGIGAPDWAAAADLG